MIGSLYNNAYVTCDSLTVVIRFRAADMKNWMMCNRITTAGLLALAIVLSSVAAFAQKEAKKPLAPVFSVSSPAFANGASMPEKHTCDGINVLPSVDIRYIPAKAKSVALIIDDPDSPSGKWTHLALWNLPPRPVHIEEGKIPAYATVASNDFGNIGYGGPCPPRVHKVTVHHYVFRAYALDSAIDLPRASKRMDLDKLMTGHVLSKAEYVGTYERVGAQKPPKVDYNGKPLPTKAN